LLRMSQWCTLLFEMLPSRMVWYHIARNQKIGFIIVFQELEDWGF
jgi:hypothetical protein